MQAYFFEKRLLLWLGGLGAFARDLLFTREYSAALLAAILVCAFAPTAQGQAQVFRCAANGVVTFSDRPCGADAEPYEADDARISTFTAPPPATAATRAVARPKKVTNSRRDSIAAAQTKHAESCARIERSLRDIRSTMRSGYTAKEGERLNERERKLVTQRREQRC